MVRSDININKTVISVVKKTKEKINTVFNNDGYTCTVMLVRAIPHLQPYLSDSCINDSTYREQEVSKRHIRERLRKKEQIDVNQQVL